MSIFVIASSDKNKNYFPNNVPHHFKTSFKHSLLMEGTWKVALTEIDFDEKITASILYVECSVCEGTIVDGINTNVLRKVNTDMRRSFSNSFNWLYYIHVIKPEIRDIEITLKDSNGSLATFLTKPVTITLHFLKT